MNVEPELLLIVNKKMRIYSSASIAANPLCLLHNSHLVHKDICFSQCKYSNLSYAGQKTTTTQNALYHYAGAAGTAG